MAKPMTLPWAQNFSQLNRMKKFGTVDSPSPTTGAGKSGQYKRLVPVLKQFVRAFFSLFITLGHTKSDTHLLKYRLLLYRWKTFISLALIPSFIFFLNY
jgi:hypothetical protein